MPEKINVPFYAYKGDEPYIFISYSHRDSDKVFPIIKQFNDSGFNIWYDEGIDPGNEWPLEIERALKNSGMFLVFITPNSVKSRNVRNEINYALSNNLPFLAVYLEETELVEGLGLQMGSTQAIMKYRMDDNAFYYKSETVFNQMLSMENRTQTALSVKPKRKANIKKLAIFGGGGAVLITGIVIFIIMILSGGNISYVNKSMGIAFSYPKGWKITDESSSLVTLNNDKTGMDIHIYDITHDIITDMADNGNDIITAAEHAVYEYARIVGYVPFGDIYDYACRIDFNDRMMLEGMGSFLFNPDGGELYVDSSGTDFMVRQNENRIFVYAKSIPGDYNGKHYIYTDYEKFDKVYNEILDTLTIEKNPMSIEERVAEMTPKG